MQEKEKNKVKEKLERYTKEGLGQLIDVLDLHLPKTGKKVMAPCLLTFVCLLPVLLLIKSPRTVGFPFSLLLMVYLFPGRAGGQSAPIS